MSFQKALLISLGLGTLCGAAGCSAKADAPDGTGGAGGETGCSTIDYASYKTGATVSFKNDIMPIFGSACATSSCHNVHDHIAGLNLGVRCTPPPKGVTVCTFPDTVDTSGNSSNPPAPLTPQIISDAYTSLMQASTTVQAGNVMRVVPGDPEKSFVIQKVTGTQGDQGYTTCKSQDSSHAVTPDPCGDSMPLGTLLCEGSSRPRFDMLARWIAQGALQ
jgi:hypothetical protein